MGGEGVGWGCSGGEWLGGGGVHLKHLQKEGGEGDELADSLAQAQQSPNAAQAQGEVARGGHQPHTPYQHLCQWIHKWPQLLHHASQHQAMLFHFFHFIATCIPVVVSLFQLFHFLATCMSVVVLL